MSTEQKIKQSIYNTTRKICKEIAEELKIEYSSDAVDLIAELTYKKLLLYGEDLDAFQKHAKRSTITADDVKLLVRRNDSLKEIINEKHKFIVANKPPDDGTATTKRKRKAT